MATNNGNTYNFAILLQIDTSFQSQNVVTKLAAYLRDLQRERAASSSAVNIQDGGQ